MNRVVAIPLEITREIWGFLFFSGTHWITLPIRRFQEHTLKRTKIKQIELAL